MSDVIATAVKALTEKLDGNGFDAGIAKFAIDGVGAIIVDSEGAREGDDDADVTLTADADTFASILEGDVNPTAAFMQGKLGVDGDMALAMQLGSLLS